jgi:hypothetical protein
LTEKIDDHGIFFNFFTDIKNTHHRLKVSSNCNLKIFFPSTIFF